MDLQVWASPWHSPDSRCTRSWRRKIGGHFQVDADNGIRYELWLPAQSDKSSDSLFNF